MLGIANYEPTFYLDVTAFRSAHGERLRQLVGGVEQVEITEICIDLLNNWALNGILLRFNDGCLEIFNALDELGLSDEPLIADDVRRTAL